MTIMDDLREVCGLEQDKSFDKDLGLYAGGAFATMIQIGVGFDKFYIETGVEEWADFLGPEAMKTPIYPLAKQYTQLYVRELFDPPAPSTVTYIQSTLNENLWRLQVYAEELLKEGGVINGDKSE